MTSPTYIDIYIYIYLDSWSLLLSSLWSQIGKLSTGDSLDMSPHDEASIMANEAVIKDMEVISSFYFIYLFRMRLVFRK